MSDGNDYSRIFDTIRELQRAIANESNDRYNADRELNRIIESNYKELTGYIMDLRNYLGQLMQEVSRNFSVLENDVIKLINNTGQSNLLLQENQNEIKTGNVKIVSSLKEVEETSDKGLKKVSSGVAIVDVLKAMSEAHQSGTEIVRALEEVKVRLNQAEIAVEEKKKEFDKHFEKVIEGYEKQLKIIGQHVQYIIDNVLPILDELKIDELHNEKTATIIEEAQAVVINHRTENLNSQKAKLSLENLAIVRQLRNKLEQFLSDENSVRFEQIYGNGPLQELPVLNIPSYVTVTENTEFNPAGHQKKMVFALNAAAKDCYKKPEPKPEHFQLFNNLYSFADRLNETRGVTLDEQTVQNIKRGLKKLVAGGLIRSEHAQYIEDHLNKYPLTWLEF